ncbi:MAG TPA: DUF4430 domain-containing protein [Firmicutes bacterium]|jgi:hypothetical protein|nr:DUF4430 domain-containing protein [Bacillota bacterium]
MLKKLGILILALLLLFQVVPALAAGPTVACENGMVTVSGQVRPGADVSILVLRAEGGKRAYIGQSSAVDGSYEFQFPLPDGNYLVRVAADGAVVEQTCSVGGKTTADYIRVRVSVQGLTHTILAPTTVSLPKDQPATVLDALAAALAKYDIPFSVRGGYVRSIGDLAEFDHGPESGWMFSVNDDYPDVGAADWRVSDGDQIRWSYTLNLGADVGNRYQGLLSQPPLSDAEELARQQARQAADAALADLAAHLPAFFAIAVQGEVDGLGPTPPATYVVGELMSPAQQSYLAQVYSDNQAQVEEHVVPGWVTVLADAAGEVRLTIPAGALAATTTISLQEGSPCWQLPEGFQFVSPCYTWQPAGLQFQVPAELDIALNLLQLPGAIRYEDLMLVCFDTAGRPVQLPAVLDLANGRLRAPIRHFSQFVILLQSQRQFVDLADVEWAVPAIQRLADLGVLDGVGDGRFCPCADVTRAQFTKILVTALSCPVTQNGEQPFRDIFEDDWYARYVAAASVAGLVAGYPDETFHPQAAMTRAEVAALLCRAAASRGMPLPAGDITICRDALEVLPWARPGLGSCLAAGLLQGYSDGNCRPQQIMTRAEAAVAVDRLSRYLMGEGGS